MNDIFGPKVMLLAWLLVLAAGLVVTLGPPAAFSVLTDTIQLAQSAIFVER
ncbi:MAG TPA: hypothetical protein VFS62_01930 [Chloroflexota bacterium]|jgi:hypothetical protein|nr:hypothetical protein [Chloroflexota bacterium]